MTRLERRPSLLGRRTRGILRSRIELAQAREQGDRGEYRVATFPSIEAAKRVRRVRLEPLEGEPIAVEVGSHPLLDRYEGFANRRIRIAVAGDRLTLRVHPSTVASGRCRA